MRRDGGKALIGGRISGAPIALQIAQANVDRQLFARGMTVLFHGLTVSSETELRGLENARAFVAALERMQPHLAADATRATLGDHGVGGDGGGWRGDPQPRRE